MSKRSKRAVPALFAGFAAVCLACTHNVEAPSAPPPEAVSVDAHLSNKFVKAGSSQSLIARIDLSAKKPTHHDRPPVNLALLIDTSGSMEGKAITDARAAARALVSTLAPDDKLAIVGFGSRGDVLMHTARVGDVGDAALDRTIDKIKAEGTTDMAAGMRLALSEVEQNLSKEGVNRIVFLGDGVPNEEEPVLPLIEEAKTQGVSITTLGLGPDYDEGLMGRIAKATGGRFHDVDDSTKVASFFKEEVTRLHKVVARQAVLEIHPGPGVVVKRVIGRPAQQSGRWLVVPLGDISLGDEQHLVVEVATASAKEGAPVEVLDAVVRYQDGVGEEMHDTRAFAGAHATKDDDVLAKGRDQSVEDAATKARDAAALVEANERARAHDRGAMNGPNNVQAQPADLDKSSYASPAAPKAGPAPAPAAAPAPPMPRREALHRNDEAMHVLGY